MSDQVLKVKILKGLPMAFAKEHRHLFKALETFLYLKALYVDQAINPDKTTLKTVAANVATYSLRHPKTILRRIEQLRAIQWLNIGKDQKLHAISWDAICEKFGIAHKRFYYVKPVDKVQLEYIIKAKVFLEKEEHCYAGYRANRKRNAMRMELIKEVTGSVQAEAVAFHQLDCFKSEGESYSEDAAFALSTWYSNKEEGLLRGDMAINYGTIKKLFAYKGNGSVAKLKRSLANKGVISVQKRSVTLDKGTHTTSVSRYTRLGFVKWNEVTRKVELIMPDKIIVIPTAQIDQFYSVQRSMQQKWKEEIENRLNDAIAA